MVERRKGIGYIIEALAALLVLFIFVAGNTPAEPSTDWNSFQEELVSQDITIVMDKTGDVEDFIRNGETGTLMTMAETLSRGSLTASGTVENVPISTQIVGFHVLENDRENMTFDSVQDLGDQCYQDNDLEEIEPEDGEVMRTLNSRDGVYLYVADTDPDLSGGNGNLDYDSVWVDNATRCQFSAAEGPHYIDEFFYWGNSSGQEHYDINNIYESSNELEIYLATQVADMRPRLESRVNGIDTGIVVDTMAADIDRLDSYDILVFRERQAIPTLNSQSSELKKYLSSGAIFLMMDLQKQDFYNGDSPADNFITDTGLRWVDLGYKAKPSSPAGGEFHPHSASSDLETYFRGLNGDRNALDLRPSGNVTSSNGVNFKDSKPLLSTGTGAYDRTEWNATDYSMSQVDPDTIDGYPETACVESSPSSSLTKGEFDFHDYQANDFKKYDVINTELGESDTFCTNNDVRALNIDLDDDGNYGEEGEGPYLDGEILEVENKTFTINFPSDSALANGDAAEFVYNGESDVESINYRTSFEGFNGRKLARIGYKQSYSPEERKMITSVVHWLSVENVRFGARQDTTISTEAVGGVKENTFIPYKILIRWK